MTRPLPRRHTRPAGHQLQRRGRSRDRCHAPLHDRCATVLSPGSNRCAGHGPGAVFHRKAVSFPTNINVEVTQTFLSGTDPVVSGTVLTHHSLIKLPEQPMMPRLFDERVGYYSQGLLDFGTEEPRVARKRYIRRWRLEKKDPTLAISEPVKPIVYYIDPATPTKWVSYIKQGVEDWQVAFEAAGFKIAIVAREAPAGDPDWSPEDARYSVIRWLPTTESVANGPHVHDPRYWRDSRSRHPVQSQYPTRLAEPLREDRAARSARPDAAALRRSHGPLPAPNHRTRGGPYAGPEPQHEGRRRLHDRPD